MVERVFRAVDRTGVERQFELVPPNLAAENEGERRFKIAYAQALRDGIFPKEKLREIMVEHEMWTEQDEKHLKEYIAKLAVLQIELEANQRSGDEDRCLTVAKEMTELRGRMWELFMVQQTVYLNSAEGVAETIKLEAVMAACTVLKDTGERYWKDYTEFVQERDFNDKSQVHTAVVLVQSKLLDDLRKGMLDEYPEKQFLKDINERMLDRDIESEVLDQVKQRATDALNKLEEKEKTKPKRKPARKKVTKRRGKGMGTKTN
jgi:wyosine [tRNA(Phe)-imidazoG37] synthetase (radical SAM superfamily)